MNESAKNRIEKEADWRTTNGHGGVDALSREYFIAGAEYEHDALVNNPEIEDFVKGVQLEAAHQLERWGIENEEANPPHHFVLVMAKLLGKLSTDIFDRDHEKFKHHCIAIAAEMHNIHRQVDKEGTQINHWFFKRDGGI